MVGRPSIAPAIENQRAPLLHLYSPAKEKLWLEVFLPNRGVKVARVASGHGATRWAREISRHVVVLHGHAARTGGDVELFYRRSRYAPARLPIVAETLPVRGSVRAWVSPDRVALARFTRRARPKAERPAISARVHRVPRRELASRRPALGNVYLPRASYCRRLIIVVPSTDHFLSFPPRQASHCPLRSPQSASPSGARKPCPHPTRTRSPRRSEEATDARAWWRREVAA